jgi:hypothetical protein
MSLARKDRHAIAFSRDGRTILMGRSRSLAATLIIKQ